MSKAYLFQVGIHKKIKHISCNKFIVPWHLMHIDSINYLNGMYAFNLLLPTKRRNCLNDVLSAPQAPPGTPGHPRHPQAQPGTPGHPGHPGHPRTPGPPPYTPEAPQAPSCTPRHSSHLYLSLRCWHISVAVLRFSFWCWGKIFI